MSWCVVLLGLGPLLAAASFLGWARSMLRNYTAARSIGFPIRVIPFSPFNPFWSLVDRKVVSLLRRLPYVGQSTITRYNWRGWDLEDRWQCHYEMGDAFVLVTAQDNMLQLNDPDATTNVFKRATDFPRPVWVNDVLAVFGPNISTAEGQSWKTQRRVATRCFNEANNEIVWSETLGLSQDMLHYWASKTTVDSGAEDIRTLTLNVLARAGFGKSFEFRGHTEVRPTEEIQSMSYRESLGIILENCIVILALGPKTLTSLARVWLPSKFRRVNKAVISFQTHMTTLHEEQKRAFAAGEKNADNNLMTPLVRASQEAASERSDQGLTESDIYGNMSRIGSRRRSAPSSRGRQPHELDYRADFPRLRRCLAVLYETLRLYTVVPAIKWTGDRPTTTLAVGGGGQTLSLPPRTIVLPILGARLAGVAAVAEMDLNRRGVFLGWSQGTRDCPGKKFSQVEFVALTLGLFWKWRVDPAREHQGESDEAARRRVLDLIARQTGWILLLQMLRPERAPLVWRKLS
ncbi:hypothetical protein Daus18300_009706 [Diaporthe australafricana]|uniref:Cytochrome P450 n=1 Tax=Diaporthe australafricana TaxID=127596 RepID=A0ABR3WE00_9PEZI